MLVELPKEQYSLVRNMGRITTFPIIASVAYGVQNGKIFVDDILAPNIVFVTHISSFCYLHIGKKGINYNQLFDFLYSSKDTPQYFHLYDADDHIIEEVKKYIHFNIKVRNRVRMKGSYDTIGDKSINLDEKFRAVPIQDLKEEQIKDFDLSNISNFYTSKRDFLNNTIGWSITLNGNAIALYYTVCMVHNNCEGDIWTFPDYRGLGLATVMGKKIMETYKAKGINMDWDVFPDNVPSLKIAQGFGFSPYLSYNFLSLFKNSLHA